MAKPSNVRELRKRLGVGQSVADELLTLAGEDVDLAAECSIKSTGLDQAKAAIIDCRFKRLEDKHGQP